MRVPLLAATLALAVPGHAGEPIRIDRSLYVERVEQSDGHTVRSLAPADTLREGDRVVLILRWQAPQRSREGFVVSTRLPDRLVFRQAGSVTPQYSIDGGQNWGPLSAQRVGLRRANESDVTNVRWIIPPEIAARGRGMLTYSAQVR